MTMKIFRKPSGERYVSEKVVPSEWDPMLQKLSQFPVAYHELLNDGRWYVRFTDGSEILVPSTSQSPQGLIEFLLRPNPEILSKIEEVRAVIKFSDNERQLFTFPLPDAWDTFLHKAKSAILTAYYKIEDDWELHFNDNKIVTVKSVEGVEDGHLQPILDALVRSNGPVKYVQEYEGEEKPTKPSSGSETPPSPTTAPSGAPTTTSTAAPGTTKPVKPVKTGGKPNPSS